MPWRRRGCSWCRHRTRACPSSPWRAGRSGGLCWPTGCPRSCADTACAATADSGTAPTRSSARRCGFSSRDPASPTLWAAPVRPTSPSTTSGASPWTNTAPSLRTLPPDLHAALDALGRRAKCALPREVRAVLGALRRLVAPPAPPPPPAQDEIDVRELLRRYTVEELAETAEAQMAQVKSRDYHL